MINSRNLIYTNILDLTPNSLLLRQVLVLKKLAVYPNSFGVIPVNVIFNSED